MSRIVGRLYIIEPTLGRCKRCQQIVDIREDMLCGACMRPPEVAAWEARVQAEIAAAAMVVDNRRGFKLPNTEDAILHAIGQSLPDKS